MLALKGGNRAFPGSSCLLRVALSIFHKFHGSANGRDTAALISELSPRAACFFLIQLNFFNRRHLGFSSLYAIVFFFFFLKIQIKIKGIRDFTMKLFRVCRLRGWLLKNEEQNWHLVTITFHIERLHYYTLKYFIHIGILTPLNKFLTMTTFLLCVNLRILYIKLLNTVQFFHTSILLVKKVDIILNCLI